MRKKTNATPGLTTVEIIVSITISAIVILGLIPILTNFFNSLQDLIGRTKQSNDMYSAIQSIQKDILYSTAFLRFSSLDDEESSTQNLRWGWRKQIWDFKGRNPNGNNLILQKILTKRSYVSHDLTIIGRGKGFSASCTGDYASPVYYNIIYYLDGETLYRRTIAPAPDSQIADTPGDTENMFINDIRAPWCNYISEANEKTTTRTGRSGAKDTVILKNVDKFSIDYFDTPYAQNPADYRSLVNNEGGSESVQAATRRLIYLPNNPKDIRITIRTKKTINNKENIFTVSTRGAIAW